MTKTTWWSSSSLGSGESNVPGRVTALASARCDRPVCGCVCSKKACKYFDQGRGSCPFGGKCLYLHAFPDGTRAEPERPRKQLGSEGNIRVSGGSRVSTASPGECRSYVTQVCFPFQFMNNVRLWDFIEEREQRSVPPLPSFDDDLTELRELFMQMSGPSQDENTPGADQ